jgi:hypothetical protein
MKSSDNTLLLAGLFVLIVVIIALIVYYTRPGETKTSDQTSDTTKLTVENLTFERTLNPDPSVGEGVSGYTIEPYGVEYAGSANYTELSKNVTFTMIWDNAPGFNNVVKGFKIEHYVDTDNKHMFQYNSEITEVGGESISFSDFGKCTVKLTNANWTTPGDVIGQNKFKLFAVRIDESADDLLYDGTTGTDFPAALKISKSQLSVTLSMTTPETATFEPEKTEGTSTRAVISKTIYDIFNTHTTLTKNGIGIYLETVENSNNKHFYFQYEDGKYLLGDLSKGSPTNDNPKLKVEIVNKETGTSSGQIKKVGADKYLSSPEKLSASEDPKLGLYTTNDSRLNKKTFEGFKWTFNERISKSLVPNGNFVATDNNGKFGNVVCVSGDDAFVGQPGSVFQNYSNAGRVHIYRREGGVWNFKKTINSGITGTTPGANRYFGCSVSISKDYAVIGEKKSPGKNNASGAGKVYILKRSADGNWETRTQGTLNSSSLSDEEKQRYPISIKGPVQNEEFGSSVAVSGNFLVVGAPGIGTYEGRVRLYKLVNNNGTLFTPSRGVQAGKSSGERFGYAVDISGDRVIVGAPYKGEVFQDTPCDSTLTEQISIQRIHCPDKEKKNPPKTGSVSIYKIGRDAQNAEQLVLEREMNPRKWMTQPDGDTRFGESVAIDGMIAVIGIPGKKGFRTLPDDANVGGVYVLKGNGDRKTGNGNPEVRWDYLSFREFIGDWDRDGELPVIPNVRKGGEFGKSVSISGDTICIGQPGGDSGDVYVYKYKLVNTDTYYYGESNASSTVEPRIKMDLVKTIKSPTNTSGGKFGKSVSNSDGYVMIGEPEADLTVGTGKKRVGSAFITAI